MSEHFYQGASAFSFLWQLYSEGCDITEYLLLLLTAAGCPCLVQLTDSFHLAFSAASLGTAAHWWWSHGIRSNWRLTAQSTCCVTCPASRAPPPSRVTWALDTSAMWPRQLAPDNWWAAPHWRMVPTPPSASGPATSVPQLWHQCHNTLFSQYSEKAPSPYLGPSPCWEHLQHTTTFTL